MNLKVSIRDFLVSRRARLTPEQAGLPGYGGRRRRVEGLRREEVAMLAGVSVDYYTRLERGNLGGVSTEVLAALSHALQLDEAERLHLRHLARAAQTRGEVRPRDRHCVPTAIRPAVQRMLDAMPGAPAFVRNRQFDVLGANQLGRALYAPVYESARRLGHPANTARFHFLDPVTSRRYWEGCWDKTARNAVALLNAELGRRPDHPGLTGLVEELSRSSEDFATLWARHDVRFHRSGNKHIQHPTVGLLELDYEALDLCADPELQLNVYTAAPGSPSDDGLQLLATWAATGVVDVIDAGRGDAGAESPSAASQHVSKW